MFFWSSSELSTTVELDRSGKPSDSRRLDELDADAAAALSLAAFSLLRFPYLFFRYLAHELNAAPSFSPDPANTAKMRFVVKSTLASFYFYIESRQLLISVQVCYRNICVVSLRIYYLNHNSYWQMDQYEMRVGAQRLNSLQVVTRTSI